jgi:hypothetical protein
VPAKSQACTKTRAEKTKKRKKENNFKYSTDFDTFCGLTGSLRSLFLATGGSRDFIKYSSLWTS